MEYSILQHPLTPILVFALVFAIQKVLSGPSRWVFVLCFVAAVLMAHLLGDVGLWSVALVGSAVMTALTGFGSRSEGCGEEESLAEAERLPVSAACGVVLRRTDSGSLATGRFLNATDHRAQAVAPRWAQVTNKVQTAE